MVAPIEISPEALEEVRKRLAARAGGSLRLGIRGGGCSGFSYALQFDDAEPGERDVSWEQDGVRVIIDKKSLAYLSGSSLGFKRALMASGFKFENPHEASKCGCGHSFNVK